MTQGKHITGFTDLLLRCIADPESILSMLEWLCEQLMGRGLPEESLTRKRTYKGIPQR
mgnify:CR=1 FL=1